MSDLNDQKQQFLDEELTHYGVPGMKWGKRGQAANYSTQQAKRDKQVYGARGTKRINKSLHEGNQISTARGDEKTRRDNVMGRNKYVRQVGKLGGAAVGGAIGFAGTRGIGMALNTVAGRKVVNKVLGEQGGYFVSKVSQEPMFQAAVAVGAGKIGHMLSGDLAVAANMRAHGYNPNRK